MVSSLLSIYYLLYDHALLLHRKESKNKRELQAWLQAFARYYADRVLPVDLETSHTWGERTAAAQKAGKIVPASGGLIAAAARHHGLHVITRNTEHERTRPLDPHSR